MALFASSVTALTEGYIKRGQQSLPSNATVNVVIMTWMYLTDEFVSSAPFSSIAFPFIHNRISVFRLKNT